MIHCSLKAGGSDGRNDSPKWHLRNAHKAARLGGGNASCSDFVKLGKGRHILHDLFDDMQKHRVEVKFSAVRKKSEIAITEQTVLQAIAAAAAGEERMVDYSNWKNATFDSNIQQIKEETV